MTPTPAAARVRGVFLDASRGEAQALARESPDDYQVGSGAWVTARFSVDKPMPRRLWEEVAQREL